jgi:hypothetical protein
MRGGAMTRPRDQRTERLLALLCGFVSGVLVGGAVGYTVGAGWLPACR